MSRMTTSDILDLCQQITTWTNELRSLEERGGEALYIGRHSFSAEAIGYAHAIDRLGRMLFDATTRLGAEYVRPGGMPNAQAPMTKVTEAAP
jgi:hypothetical protein